MQQVFRDVFKNHLIKIFVDENPEDPRKWDNMSTMVCFHRRYNLGDKHEYKKHDYTSWEDLEKNIIEDNGPCLIYPLYLYDHSGISISMGKDREKGWDSCCVGFIFISYAKIRQEYSVKRITKKTLARAQKCLEAELKTYDEFLTGEVYGFQVFDSPEDDNEIESCWGFYGEIDGEYSALAEARRIVNDRTDVFRNAIREGIKQAEARQKDELADKLDVALEHQKELNMAGV